MAQSYTGTITAPDWESVATLTGVTFTSGNIYNMQVKNQCQIKIGNAIFDVENREIIYVAGTDAMYIKTGGISCRLTVLEAE